MKKIMYKCEDCGCIFDKEDAGTHSEWIGEGGIMSGYIHYLGCPECNSENLSDAKECDCCGEAFGIDDLVEVDDAMYCKECAGRIHDAYWMKWGKDEKTAC